MISIFIGSCWIETIERLAKQIFVTPYRSNGTCTWPVHGNISACIFPQAKYNSQRLFFQPVQLRTAVYFLHINLGRTISLCLLLPKYTINDWSMADSLLFCFKRRSLSTTLRLSWIYTVRSWWILNKSSECIWMNTCFCWTYYQKKISQYHQKRLQHNFDKFNYDLHNSLHNSTHCITAQLSN